MFFFIPEGPSELPSALPWRLFWALDEEGVWSASTLSGPLIFLPSLSDPDRKKAHSALAHQSEGRYVPISALLIMGALFLVEGGVAHLWVQLFAVSLASKLPPFTIAQQLLTHSGVSKGALFPLSIHFHLS